MDLGYEQLYRRRWYRRRLLASGVVGLAVGATGAVLTMLLMLGYEPADKFPDSLGPCEELPGLPTVEVAMVGVCDDRSVADTVLWSATYDCTDGRRILWNDWGWGYINSTWQAHEHKDGQLVPSGEEISTCLG